LVLQSKILIGSSCKLFFKSQISNLKDNFALRREKRRKKKKRKRKNKKPRERGRDHKKKTLPLLGHHYLCHQYLPQQLLPCLEPTPR